MEVTMTCGFCAKEARERAFTGRGRGGGRRDCICYDCVCELYVAMIAPEMQPPQPIRNPARALAPGGRIIRLYPRPG
jgi:hypothetical protein